MRDLNLQISASVKNQKLSIKPEFTILWGETKIQFNFFITEVHWNLNSSAAEIVLVHACYLDTCAAPTHTHGQQSPTRKNKYFCCVCPGRLLVWYMKKYPVRSIITMLFCCSILPISCTKYINNVVLFHYLVHLWVSHM